MNPSTEQVAAANPNWGKFGRGTVLPLLLLVGLLVLLGHFHIDLATAYTAPRVTGDGRGGFAFYHGGNAGFFMRPTQDGQTFGKKTWVQGVLVDAALTDEHLYALLTDRERRTWFYSVYLRKTLERLWSGEFTDPELELAHPRHIAALGSHVYVLGTDRLGALRAAKINDEMALAPVQQGAEAVTLPGAAVLAQAKASEAGVPPPTGFTSAVDEGRLTLFWRVEQEDSGGGPAGGEVRWTTFDGQSFGALGAFPYDLSAMAAGLDPGAPLGSRLRLFGVPFRSQDANVRVFARRAGAFVEAEPVAYEREGLTGGAGITHLATGQAAGRELLLAQIGGVIRYTSRGPDEPWRPWEDLARRPAEQTAVVYGWFGSLLLLSAALIYQGAASWRRRSRPRSGHAQAEAGPGEPTGEVATISERVLAFGVDLLFVALCCWLVVGSFPHLLERASGEPGARMAWLAWFVILLLTYLTTCEALFARSLGKALLGLEVQTLEGGRPGLTASLYRNAFRVELLVPPPYLVPLLSLLVMISSPFHQRPGDLVARTVVRRVA